MKNQKLEGLLNKLESLSTESHCEITNMTAAVAAQLRGGSAAALSANSTCTGNNATCENGTCTGTNGVCKDDCCSL